MACKAGSKEKLTTVLVESEAQHQNEVEQLLAYDKKVDALCVVQDRLERKRNTLKCCKSECKTGSNVLCKKDSLANKDLLDLTMGYHFFQVTYIITFRKGKIYNGASLSQCGGDLSFLS